MAKALAFVLNLSKDRNGNPLGNESFQVSIVASSSDSALSKFSAANSSLAQKPCLAACEIYHENFVTSLLKKKSSLYKVRELAERAVSSVAKKERNKDSN